jgi:predicted GH43/DUF377 family glycosyl hydrolase
MNKLRPILLFAGLLGLASPGALVAQPAPAAPKRPTRIELVPTLEKPRNARAPEERDLAGYLMVYFKDQTHSAYLAISRDGYTFTDLNAGQPVFDGTQLAEQKGVRDPHIERGPDGAFYVAMTDLHISAQRAGHRTTQWQRPEPQYGWGNNRALVLMKSYDLIRWTAADFRVDLAFPEFAEVGCIWAPATIFDEQKGKMMITFTLKLGRGVDDLYYAYTDDAFTKMETKPERFFRFPYPDGPLTDDVRNKHHVIDPDITKVGDKFHLFYSSKETGTPGIEHTVSDRINDGYPVVQKRLDLEKTSCEAPTLFKRLGTDRYVLMYDAYGAGNMAFAETTDFVTFKSLGLFNAGVMKGTNFDRPKHGAVTHLTLAELKAIKAHWGVDINLE